MADEQRPTHYHWWQTGVIYQIYPRSFKDSDADGTGDLAGVIEKLDHLSDTLGVDAFWLSPFYPSPMKDFGYDVSDYTGVDPIFGDLETFDRLLAEAHRRNLRVIIDLVPNHSSDQHPWFQESRRSRDNSKSDWYVWKDPKPDGSLPNNWLSNFGGPAWEWEEARGQYYLHSFLKEQPDLNWRNPEVQEAIFDAVRFWLERGVDGFRIDVAHYIMKDPDFRDNPPNPKPGSWANFRPATDYENQLHIFNKGHADTHDVYREFRKVLDEYSQERPRMAVGEIHIFDWAVWASYYGEDLDELHMPFNFALIGVRWEAEEVRAVVDGLEAALPTGAWPNYVLGNHDEPRLASRVGAAQARVGAMLLLTLRGTPTLYYGDELGMENVSIPREKEQDPYGIRVPGMSRDGARTPMQWDAGPGAGFSDAPPEKLWLPLSPDYEQVNVAVELDQPDSFLSLYRRLLEIRRGAPSLQWGDYTPIENVPRGVFAYLRTAQGHPGYLIALNFTAEPVDIDLREYRGRLALTTYLDGAPGELPKITLRENEGLLYQLE